MNKFELFCMIYLALDADWEETGNEELREFLSDMDPFLFKEITSADPATYASFEKHISEENISLDKSFEIAKEYLRWVGVPSAIESFELLEEEQWVNATKHYLQEQHKVSTL